LSENSEYESEYIRNMKGCQGRNYVYTINIEWRSEAVGSASNS